MKEWKYLSSYEISSDQLLKAVQQTLAGLGYAAEPQQIPIRTLPNTTARAPDLQRTPSKQRIPDTNVYFPLSKRELGEFGAVVIRSSNPGYSILGIAPQQKSTREPTPQELNAIKSIADPQARAKQFAELYEEIKQEAIELDQRRAAHLAQMAETFWYTLEVVWRTLNPEWADKLHGFREVRRADREGATRAPIDVRVPFKNVLDNPLQPPTPTEPATMQAQSVKSSKLDSKSKHYDIFISYSSLDERIAEKIAALLSEAGLTYWLDKKDILIGEQMLDRVRDGITKESDYTLIVLSKNSVASEWCKEEIRIAYQKEFDLKRVVLLPITIDQAEIPAEVRTKKYYRLDTSNDESFQSLVREIKTLIDKQSLS